MIRLDYRDARPIYEQVKDGLRRLMVTGVLAPGEKLPSVRSLAMDLAINPNTIQRAYAQLEREGYIYSIKGKGSFVADNSRMKAGILREWKKEFVSCVKQGLKIGIGTDEMEHLVKEAREQQGQEGSGTDD